MAVKIKNTPSPDVLMNSMRSIGYNFRTALADIIDNSISAKAKNIYISSPINDEKIFIAILDDGEGMDDSELFNAMKYGSNKEYYGVNDLGRFGLWLKSASLSQCRILTVASKKENVIVAYQWDLDSVIKNREWDCLKLENHEIDSIPNIENLRKLTQGTLVVWENFDIGYKKSGGRIRDYLCDEIDDAESHIRLVFHRFLSNNFKPLKIYINQVNRLYAPDFGIPQNRKRLLMLSVYVGDDENAKQIVKKYFKEHDLNDPNYIKTLNIKMQKLSKFLKLDYTNKTYLAEAVLSQPNDTESRKSIWEKNSKILLEDGTMKNIVQTITTKQDRHLNSGNIYFNPNNTKSKYRFLTPRECFVLMGFDEKDYEKIINNNFNSRKNSLFFSRDKMYKLAGNSIVVNMLEAIFEQAMDLNNILYNEEYRAKY